MMSPLRLLKTLLLPLALWAASTTAKADHVLYDDSLENGWQNWSWASVDAASAAYAHTGSLSTAVTASPWSALSLHNNPVSTTNYGKLSFWANGGATGGQTFWVIALVNDVPQPAYSVGPLAANSWQHIEIPLSQLGAAGVTNLTGLWLQENTGNNQATYYVDDVTLVTSVPVTPPDPVEGMSVYEDGLNNGWQNWSWTSVNTGSSALVRTGEASVAVDTGAWGGVNFHHDALSTSGYGTVSFWLNGGSVGGQVLRFSALLGGVTQNEKVIGPLVANQWTKYTYTLADLGIENAANLSDLRWQEGTGNSQPTYYIDDIAINLLPPPSQINVTVDTKRGIQRVDSRLFGFNTAIWDSAFNTATTAELLTEADNQVLRFPGGSASDDYHWATNTSGTNAWAWATGFDAFAAIAKPTAAKVYITVNYGTGTPEEAAAWVRYANRTKRLGFKYWEVGNENYGTWEIDANARPHDPYTYAVRFKDYYKKMKAVDPSIKIGAVVVTGEDTSVNYTDHPVVNPRTGVTHNGWTPVMLATMKSLGVTPDFISYHRYAQAPGGESDAFLLSSSSTWMEDAADLRQQLKDYLGRCSDKVELACTENNSVYGDPGKQSTSLVNGLFFADSLGNIMKTEFRSLLWWDWRNGQDASKNNSKSLYGWRNYGDYGVVNAANPAGPADRYPTFYVFKLTQFFARGGERVLETTSDYSGLSVYAVRADHREVRLLVINKNRYHSLKGSFSLSGVPFEDVATVKTYGIPQDEAARTGVGSADLASGTLPVSGTTFTYNAEPYSVSVITLKRARGHERDHGDRDDRDCDRDE